MPDCDKCGLLEICATPNMPSYGPENAPLLVAGEAPGADEDRVGKPFVGQSGATIREALSACGMDPESVRWTNVVRCRPPENKIADKYIKACKQQLLDEIAASVHKVVLLAGATALKAVLGYNGITSWQGTVLEHDGKIYIPVLHPASFLYSQGDSDYAERFETWVSHIETAVGIATDGKVRRQAADSHYEYIYVDSQSKLEAMEVDLLSSAGFAWDTEVGNVRAYGRDNRLLCASFATDKRAYCLPIDHIETPWTEDALDGYVYHSLVRILTSDLPKMGHNVKFDQVQVYALTGIWVENIVGDSMIVSHFIDSRPGRHGLKELAGKHLGMYQYDAELEAYKASHKECDPGRTWKVNGVTQRGTYANIPMRVLWPYSARDAAATYLLHDKLVQEMTDKQWVHYSEGKMPESTAFARIERNGIKIDPYIARRYKTIYMLYKDRIVERELLKDRDLKRMVHDRQQAIDAEDYAKSRKKPSKPFQFNPNSNVQVGEWLYDYMKLPTNTGGGGKHGGGGKNGESARTTKADYLKAYYPKHPILQRYVYTKQLLTAVSRYLGPALLTSEPGYKGWIDTDGLSRSNYQLIGTITGRPSSKEPNFLNMPAPDKWPNTLFSWLPVRNVFTHRWDGGCVLSADYSGMELRVMASYAYHLFGDSSMLDAFKSGIDIHRYVASKILKKPPEQVTTPERYRCKWTNWTILYGGDEHTLHSLYGLPTEEARAIIDAYFAEFWGVKAYQEYIREHAIEHGWVESLYGRRIYDANARDRDGGRRAAAIRSLTNAPIQGAAYDTLGLATVVIDEEMRRQKVRSLLCNSVYDSLMADVYPGELEQMAVIIKFAMENIVDIAKDRFPSIDLDWLVTPLACDLETSSHYGSMVHYRFVRGQEDKDDDVRLVFEQLEEEDHVEAELEEVA